MAVPAKRTPRVFQQPDGSTVTIVLHGDERSHFYSTLDGVMLKKDDNGYMKYAVSDASGVIVAGEYVAQDIEQRDAAEKNYISQINKVQIESILKAKRAKSKRAKSPAKVGSNFPNKGDVKGLIILAQFKDKPFSKGGTNQEFTNMMNEQGYSVNGATGSAKDYFIDQSSNVFNPAFTVVGPVELPQNMSYYGKNDYSGNDVDPAQMVVDACNAAKSQINFSDYDLDNNGIVDLIYIIYSGYGEAQGGEANTIWPHAWDLASAGKSLTLNGVKILNYACSSELMGDAGSELDGIGTFCHEFSHCLGLADMYDTNYAGNFGLGEWDIMDAGSYNNDSKTPVSYSGFERSSVGWTTLEELETPQNNISLEAITESNKAYKITSSVNPDEYYVLENRQLVGWDEYLPNHGLLITHIDYLQSAWDNNSVNDVAGHQRVIIIPADNKLLVWNDNRDAYFASLEGDVYPGTSKNNSLTDTSVPAATLYKGGKMGKPITNIKEVNGIISFNFMEGVVAAPVAAQATDITNTGFTANWSAVDGVDSYTLTVKEASTDPEANMVIKEDFSNFTAEKDGTAEIEVDDFMNNKGWEGIKIFNSSNKCKMGTSKVPGTLTSPALDLSADNGNVTIHLNVQAYNTEKTLKIELLNASDGLIETKDITLPYNSVVSFTKGANGCKIRFTANKRAYMSYIAIYTGQYDESDLQKAIGKVAAKEQVITDITTTSYTVSNLTPGLVYTYKVTAKKGESVSPFSNAVKVDISMAGVCDRPQLNNHIRTIGNNVIVSTTEGKMINIYSIDGVLKHSAVATEGENRFSLSGGIYIVRVDATSAKVVILDK